MVCLTALQGCCHTGLHVLMGMLIRTMISDQTGLHVLMGMLVRVLITSTHTELRVLMGTLIRILSAGIVVGM
jgi:hypothetical protein